MNHENRTVVEQVRTAVEKSLKLSSAAPSDALELTSANTASPAAPVPPVELGLDELRSLTVELEALRLNIDAQPPSPRTIRGKFGGLLIRFLRKPLWWHTWRINMFAATLGRHQDVADVVFERTERYLQTIEARCMHLEAAQLQAQSGYADTASREEVESIKNRVAQLSESIEALRADVKSSQPRWPVSKEHQDLYSVFQDSFRGSRDEISEKQKVYLPYLTDADLGHPDSPVLDLGCGRGEWLELLRRYQITAQGLDINPAMVSLCQTLGLNVLRGDALVHLRAVPDQSQGAITAFHLIEHVPFETLLELIDQSLRVLRPGGIMILETPNPKNLRVGSESFYLDPTHLRPLPSAMVRFFVEARGFSDVHILELSPSPAEILQQYPDRELATQLNSCLLGPRDYGVLGVKPPSQSAD